MSVRDPKETEMCELPPQRIKNSYFKEAELRKHIETIQAC